MHAAHGYRCFWCGKHPVPTMSRVCAKCKAEYDARAVGMPATDFKDSREQARGMREVKANTQRRKRGDCGV